MVLFISDEQHLSPLSATLYSLGLTVLYVGVLYLHPRTRPTKTARRDDPAVVKTRMVLLSIVTFAINFAVVPYILISQKVFSTWFWAWSAQKLWSPLPLQLLLDILKSLALTSILFIGPLADSLYFRYQDRRDTLGYGPSYAPPGALMTEIRRELSTLYGIRNYIVGPATEELVYRGGILALFLSTHLSLRTLVLYVPLFFAVAHVHHGYEMYLEGSYPGRLIVLTTLFQLLFTTIFGWYATFLFLRTGSVWPAFLVHSYCNALGPPEFGVVGKNRTQTLIYRLLLVVGVVGFSFALYPLTDSPNRIL